MPPKDRTQELIARFTEGLLIGDGAMGTTLSSRGHAGASLELLNAEQPDRVVAAHSAYLEAGSQVLQTNTFQGSSLALARHNLEARTPELNRRGAEIARGVAAERAFVAGSIGPTGGILEPYGDVDPEAARAAFQQQAEALAEGGVHFFIVETFSAVEEALAAIQGAATTGLPIAASMSFDPNGRTAFGVTPAQAARALSAAGAHVVGANCGTISSAEMVDILAAFRAESTLPLIAQPNAGRPERTPEGTRFPEDPEALAEAAVRFRKLGATLIGGCCGTTPDHIRAVATRLAGD
jgi:methionine synthase I (cobalamin-dependent)